MGELGLVGGGGILSFFELLFKGPWGPWDPYLISFLTISKTLVLCIVLPIVLPIADWPRLTPYWNQIKPNQVFGSLRKSSEVAQAHLLLRGPSFRNDTMAE